jgi:hypothetical protein
LYYAEPQMISPVQQIATDARGKFFLSDATTGLLNLAQRTGVTNGMKPPSGCKIRIPNVILSSANLVDYTRNTQNQTLTTRYDLATNGGGSLSFRKVMCNWYTGVTNPYSVLMEDSAFAVALSFSNVAAATTLTRVAVGPSRNTSAVALTIASCFSGGTITDCTFVRHISGGSSSAVSISIATNFTTTGTTVYAFGVNPARNVRVTYYTWSLTTTDNLMFDNCASIGAGFSAYIANNTTITNLAYADVALGTTQATNTFAASVATTDGFTLDGFVPYAGIANVHSYSGIISTNTSTFNVELKNVGTAAAPYNAGTVNPMGLFAAFLGTTIGVTMRRVYGDNLRTAAVSTVNTVQNLRMYNVWADGADSQVMVALDALAQGCRWTNPSTVQSAVYGTHWEDAFVSTTEGRLTVIGNEPIASTADQCSFTFGTGAGFTSAGNASLPNLTDTITWTMPYYALGHTGIAKFTSGVFTNPWFVTGTNVQFLEFEYQIDTGTGFSAWKHLLNQGRRSAGGGAGTNTVTLTTSDRTVMLRQPQIGDYVQSGSNRLPHGTTITNVAGDVLTLSNNFTSALTASEPILIWKDIANETISSSTGYKLKVRVKVNTANSSNLFSFLRIPFDTTSVAQQTQYPLPVTQNIGSVTSILAGSRIQVYNVTTSTEVANEIVAGTTWQYLYDEGTDFTDGDLIRVRVVRFTGSTASVGYESFAVASSTGWSLLAGQVNDAVYATLGIDGSTVTEFVFDYPNVQIDINDPDGATSIARLYSWWCKERATEDGIRTIMGGLIAEDIANYKVISSIIDLKLDNTASTGVIFTGDLRLYRDDGLAPVVNSTTGGGSITLYSGKVYVAEVGTSGLTPSEAATLSKLDTLTENVSGLRFTSKALEQAPAGGGGGTTDWTSGEREQIRHRLGINGTASAPTATPSLATPTSVRTELTTELSRIDATVSSRNAIAPDNAGIASAVSAAKLAAALSA